MLVRGLTVTSSPLLFKTTGLVTRILSMSVRLVPPMSKDMLTKAPDAAPMVIALPTKPEFCWRVKVLTVLFDIARLDPGFRRSEAPTVEAPVVPAV